MESTRQQNVKLEVQVADLSQRASPIPLKQGDTRKKLNKRELEAKVEALERQLAKSEQGCIQFRSPPTPRTPAHTLQPNAAMASTAQWSESDSSPDEQQKLRPEGAPMWGRPAPPLGHSCDPFQQRASQQELQQKVDALSAQLQLMQNR